MNCWRCKTELIWGCDFTYEDYGIDGEGIVTNLSCPNQLCNAYIEVYLPDMSDKKTLQENNKTKR